MRSRQLSDRTYARRIERALSGHRARPVVLSPRDWELLSDWHGRGVPLALVLETLDSAVEHAGRRPAGGRGPRSLSAVAPAIEEAWSVIQEGRALARTRDGDSGPPLSEAVAAWRRRAAREAGDSRLRAVLEQLLAELEAGRPPATLDEALDRELPSAGAAELVGAWQARLERDLRPYHQRMSREAFRATLDRALADQLRRVLGLPRLGLSDPDR